MTIYTTSTLPQHWIAKTADGQLFMFPTCENGWRQKRPYYGYQIGLKPVSAETARSIIKLSGASLELD